MTICRTLFLSLVISFLISPSLASAKELLAILDFENNAGLNDQEVRTLSDRFRAEVVKTDSFVVLDRANMEAVMEQQKINMLACRESSCTLRVGQLLGVEKLLLGSLGKFAGIYLISVKKINIETGVTEVTADRQCKQTVCLLDAIGELANEIAGSAPVKDPSQPGVLRIYSDQEGAEVFIDGYSYGHIKDGEFKVEDVDPGQHNIGLKRVNYSDYQKAVAVAAGDLTELRVDMQPLAVKTEDGGKKEIAASTGPWPYQLTKSEKADLRKQGCAFDDDARIIADRMAARGFDKPQYLAAYVELHNIGYAAIGGGTISDIESIAVFNYLGLTADQFVEFKNSGYELTDYVNNQVFGGRAMKIAGWTLFSIGLASDLLALVWAIGTGDNCSDYRTQDEIDTAPDPNDDEEMSQESCKDGVDASGKLAVGFGIFGGIFTATGLPLGIVGTLKTKKWLEAGSLETAPLSDLSPYRQAGPIIIDDPRLILESSELPETRISSRPKPNYSFSALRFRVDF